MAKKLTDEKYSDKEAAQRFKAALLGSRKTKSKTKPAKKKKRATA